MISEHGETKQEIATKFLSSDDFKKCFKLRDYCTFYKKNLKKIEKHIRLINKLILIIKQKNEINGFSSKWTSSIINEITTTLNKQTNLLRNCLENKNDKDSQRIAKNILKLHIMKDSLEHLIITKNEIKNFVQINAILKKLNNSEIDKLISIIETQAVDPYKFIDKNFIENSIPPKQELPKPIEQIFSNECAEIVKNSLNIEDITNFNIDKSMINKIKAISKEEIESVKNKLIPKTILQTLDTFENALNENKEKALILVKKIQEIIPTEIFFDLHKNEIIRIAENMSDADIKKKVLELIKTNEKIFILSGLSKIQSVLAPLKNLIISEDYIKTINLLYKFKVRHILNLTDNMSIPNSLKKLIEGIEHTEQINKKADLENIQNLLKNFNENKEEINDKLINISSTLKKELNNKFKLIYTKLYDDPDILNEKDFNEMKNNINKTKPAIEKLRTIINDLTNDLKTLENEQITIDVNIDKIENSVIEINKLYDDLKTHINLNANKITIDKQFFTYLDIIHKHIDPLLKLEHIINTHKNILRKSNTKFKKNEITDDDIKKDIEDVKKSLNQIFMNHDLKFNIQTNSSTISETITDIYKQSTDIVNKLFNSLDNSDIKKELSSAFANIKEIVSNILNEFKHENEFLELFNIFELREIKGTFEYDIRLPFKNNKEITYFLENIKEKNENYYLRALVNEDILLSRLKKLKESFDTTKSAIVKITNFIENEYVPVVDLITDLEKSISKAPGFKLTHNEKNKILILIQNWSEYPSEKAIDAIIKGLTFGKNLTAKERKCLGSKSSKSSIIELMDKEIFKNTQGDYLIRISDIFGSWIMGNINTDIAILEEPTYSKVRETLNNESTNKKDSQRNISKRNNKNGAGKKSKSLSIASEWKIKEYHNEHNSKISNSDGPLKKTIHKTRSLLSKTDQLLTEKATEKPPLKRSKRQSITFFLRDNLKTSSPRQKSKNIQINFPDNSPMSRSGPVLIKDFSSPETSPKNPRIVKLSSKNTSNTLVSSGPSFYESPQHSPIIKDDDTALDNNKTDDNRIKKKKSPLLTYSLNNKRSIINPETVPIIPAPLSPKNNK